MTCNQQEMTKEFEIQVKLHINEQLYKKGIITEEIYSKAKGLILKYN